MKKGIHFMYTILVINKDMVWIAFPLFAAALFIDVTLTLDVKFRHTMWSKCRPMASGFRIFIRKKLNECVNECALRNQCIGVGYWERTRLCELYSDPTPLDGERAQEHCVFVRRSDMDLENIQNNCAVGTKLDVEDMSCKVEECPPFDIASVTDGTVFGNMNQVGAQKKVVCNPGFHDPTGQTTTVCLNTGTWSHTPVCVPMPIECEILPIANGTLSNSGGPAVGPFPPGVTLTVVCDQYYEETTGQDTMLCDNTGTWTHTPECGHLNCLPFPTLHGSRSSSDDRRHAEIRCLDNYHVMSGQDTIECQENVTWTFVPVCITKDCVEPPGLKIQLHTDKKEQEDAQAVCESYNAHLVKIDSLNKMNTISNFLESCTTAADHADGIWTAGKKVLGANFVFDDNSPMPGIVGSFWQSPPDDSVYPVCVRLRRNDSGKWLWNDRTCLTISFAFLCEY